MGFPPLGTFQRNSGVTSPAQISVKTSPHRRPRGHHRSRKRSSVDGKSCCRHPLFDAGCDLFLSSKPGQFLNFHLPCLKKFQIPGQLDLVLLTEKIKRSDDCVEVHITKPNIKTSKPLLDRCLLCARHHDVLRLQVFVHDSSVSVFETLLQVYEVYEICFEKDLTRAATAARSKTMATWPSVIFTRQLRRRKTRPNGRTCLDEAQEYENI